MGRPASRRRGPVRAVVAGGGGRDSGGQAKVLQDRAGGAIWHRQVLRRPGVDARRQDRRLRPAQPLRQRGVAAEDEAADAGQPRPQAPPRVPGVLVVVVDADVAAPDDGRASPLPAAPTWLPSAGRSAPPRLRGRPGTPAPGRGRGQPGPASSAPRSRARHHRPAGPADGYESAWSPGRTRQNRAAPSTGRRSRRLSSTAAASGAAARPRHPRR